MDSVVKVWPLTSATYSSNNKLHSQNSSNRELCLQASKPSSLLRTVLAMGLTLTQPLRLLLGEAQIEKLSDLKQSDFFVCVRLFVCMCVGGEKRGQTAMCYIICRSMIFMR